MPPIRKQLKSAVPLAVVAAAVYVYEMSTTEWSMVYGLALGFVAGVWVAVVVGGRLRNGATAVASILLCLAAVESYAIVKWEEWPPLNTYTPYLDIALPDLGWGPEPGIIHHTKISAKTGQIIADVEYTIEAHCHREVTSAQNGPTVAFFGDSMTFGEGLPDYETLPQYFADLAGRALHVVNLGFPGYGPQQFLRALETNL